MFSLPIHISDNSICVQVWATNGRSREETASLRQVALLQFFSSYVSNFIAIVSSCRNDCSKSSTANCPKSLGKVSETCALGMQAHINEANTFTPLYFKMKLPELIGRSGLKSCAGGKLCVLYIKSYFLDKNDSILSHYSLLAWPWKIHFSKQNAMQLHPISPWTCYLFQDFRKQYLSGSKAFKIQALRGFEILELLKIGATIL